MAKKPSPQQLGSICRSLSKSLTQFHRSLTFIEQTREYIKHKINNNSSNLPFSTTKNPPFSRFCKEGELFPEQQLQRAQIYAGFGKDSELAHVLLNLVFISRRQRRKRCCFYRVTDTAAVAATSNTNPPNSCSMTPPLPPAPINVVGLDYELLPVSPPPLNLKKIRDGGLGECVVGRLCACEGYVASHVTFRVHIT